MAAAQGRERRTGRLTPVRLALAASVALAAASLALAVLPVYDPWAWLIWGREIAHGSLETAIGPSWKPLPAAIDVPLSLLGGAAPDAWLLVARSGAIAAALLAALLAWRLSGSAAGPGWRLTGAVLAAGSVALTGDGFTPPLRQFTGGLSEPLLVALVLGAVWAALDERRGLALGLGAAAALLRPECWPFLALYGWTLRADPRLRAASIALALAIPLAWFVPDLVGAGSPLEGGSTARGGAIEPLDALDVGWRALAAPLAAAWAGLALLLWLERGWPRRTAGILLAGAAAWTALVAVMAIAGWAGLPRFLAPATAIVAVLGGVGLARAGTLAAVSPRPSWPAAAVAATAVLALAGLGLRIAPLPGDLDRVERQARSLNSLFALAGRLGTDRLLSCGGHVRVTNFLAETALAWRIERPIGSVRALRRPRYGVVLSARPLGSGTVTGREAPWRATVLPCPEPTAAAAPGAASSASGRPIAGVSGAAR